MFSNKKTPKKAPKKEFKKLSKRRISVYDNNGRCYIYSPNLLSNGIQYSKKPRFPTENEYGHKCFFRTISCNGFLSPPSFYTPSVWDKYVYIRRKSRENGPPI
jgi:hypothetical protein